MTLLSEAALDALDFDIPIPCTWGHYRRQCDNAAAWTVTCIGCAGVVYRCDQHLAVENYRARTAPLVQCPLCRQPFKTHYEGLKAVADVQHI